MANLPEDVRISKLLRSLTNEKDVEASKKLCEKLNIAVLDTTNSTYIRRSFDILADTMIRIFKDGPIGAMPQVAEVFGKMGWIIRSEVNLYRNWLQRMFKHERIREWVMLSLEHTLRMDAKSREFRSEACHRFIEMLKEYLENIENSKHFIAITNVIQQFAQNYPKHFQSHFADIVDFVIGWHLEMDQSIEIKEHCSMILQTFKPFWLNDVSFTRNLLGQFLEDITAYGKEMERRSASPTSDHSGNGSEICIGSIVGATNSILKCIYDSPAILCQHIGVDLFKDLITNVLNVMKLIESHGDQCNNQQIDLISIYVNELIVIALDCRKHGVNTTDDLLLDMVRWQLKRLEPRVESTQKVSTILFVVFKLIAEFKTNIPMDLVEEIFSNDPTSTMHQLKLTKNRKIRKTLVKIFQAILNLKNVEILQLAYRWTIEDLTVAQQSIANSESVDTKYTLTEAECIITFHLTTLSKIAISNSSIIVMWALEPTILELLTEKLTTDRYDDLWIKAPESYHAMLTLLVSHCCNSNNFIASSVLLNSGVATLVDGIAKIQITEPVEPAPAAVEFIPGASSFHVTTNPSATSSTETSPTKFHFELILKFLSHVLNQKQLHSRHLLLILEWCENLIKQSTQFAGLLKKVNQFTEIISSINRIVNGISMPINVQLKCADCLDALYDYETIHADISVLIAESCCIQMCSSESILRDRFSHLFANLPLNVSLKQVNQFTGAAKTRQRRVHHLQHAHSWTPPNLRGGEMRSHYFAEFIRAIQVNNTSESVNQREEIVEKVLQNIFVRSIGNPVATENQLPQRKSDLEVEAFCKMAANDIRVITYWAQWEAAQFCVNNKLRTSLGKPQETFLKIESIIKENARILALKNQKTGGKIETILANQRRARILLGFMEALEKCIYNASEGCVALPPPEKPARTFFHLNAITCNEWFNRIRTAVDLVALHCMEPEMVIRYTDNVLKNLATTSKVNEPIFEHTLMTHAWALLRNGESEALHGLYTWAKVKTHKKYLWIKMAAGEFELDYS